MLCIGYAQILIWASRVGVATTEAVLVATPTPASASDDATHRLRSADPPHKGDRNFVTFQYFDAIPCLGHNALRLEC